MAHLCSDSKLVLPSPSQAEPQSLPEGELSIFDLHPPCPPAAHPVSYADSSLWPLGSHRRSALLWRTASFYTVRESVKIMLFAFPLTSMLCKQDRDSHMERRGYLHKSSHVLLKGLIILPTETMDSLDHVEVWSLGQEHQYHLEIARNAKPQAFPQTYWIRSSGSRGQKSVF